MPISFLELEPNNPLKSFFSIISIYEKKIILVVNIFENYTLTSLLSTKTKAWQDARISTLRAGTLVISPSKSTLSVNPPTPENSWELKALSNKKESPTSIGGKNYSYNNSNTMSSDVSVPVLSKQQISTCIRKQTSKKENLG